MVVDESETRAETARRRLAALMASFDAHVPPPAPPSRSRSHAAEVRRRPPEVVLRVLVALAVGAGVLLSWWLLSARPRVAGPEAVRLSAHTERAVRTLVIDVEGKVKRPGIVTLPRGSRVHEAITRAGGLADGADTSTLNLARILADGEQIVVGSPVPAVAVVPGGPPAGARVSLNSATAEQLDGLPGIGPVTAQAIISYRTQHGGFQRVEDLLDVKGIGEATLSDLKDQVSP